MLAEKKQKIKWSPNPCGNLWAKDDSKFGQKILEKFGWTPGKGLGAQEQGITDPVKLKCNSTQKGLGYDRRNKADFFQHQEEFNSILSELNSTKSASDSDTEKNRCSSLEEKSKNCKTRVHYHKFTRGKDLSRYSEKDLSCILGAIPTIGLDSSEQNPFDSPQDSNEVIDNTFYQEKLTSTLSRNEDGSNDEHAIKDEIVEVKKRKKKRKKYIPEITTLENETDVIGCVPLINNQIIQPDDQIVLENIKTSIKKKKRKYAVLEGNSINEKSVLYKLSGINNDNIKLELQTNLDSNDKIKRKKHKKNKNE